MRRCGHTHDSSVISNPRSWTFFFSIFCQRNYINFYAKKSSLSLSKFRVKIVKIARLSCGGDLESAKLNFFLFQFFANKITLSSMPENYLLVCFEMKANKRVTNFYIKGVKMVKIARLSCGGVATLTIHLWSRIHKAEFFFNFLPTNSHYPLCLKIIS